MNNFNIRRSTSNSETNASLIAARAVNIELWFRSHHAALVRWVSYKVGDRDTAQDISQSAFMYLHHLAERTEILNPRAVLYKTAGWLACNEIRRRRRSLRHCVNFEDRAAGEEYETAPEYSPENKTGARQEVELTLNVINALPEKARTAFRLNRMEGLTYGEVAQSMGVSKSSVEKYMIRALKELRCARANMS